jgi:hypothetical protein
MTKDKALKLALETLQFYASVCNEDDQLTPAKTAIAKCKAALAQPAQEPPSEWAGIKAILDEYGLQSIDFVADFKAALIGREWNFCERCGKRTADLTVIHTCTPPQEGA